MPRPSTHSQLEPDVVVPISMRQAEALPGLLGSVVPAMLAAHSRYAVTVGGAKTLYVLVPSFKTRSALRAATLAAGRLKSEVAQ